MSVTPLVGVHFFLAAGLAWLMRGHILASAFGTAIGNPWTFPVIWVTTYYSGQIILGQGLPSADMTVNFADMFSGLIRSMIEADSALFKEKVWPVWWPMIVGSIPAALVTWGVMYTIFYRLVEAYQKRRAARMAARAARDDMKTRATKREAS